MFDTILALGTIAIQLFLVATLLAWATKAPFAKWVARNSSFILGGIFIASVIGSVTYELFLDYPPCILCWYQRLAIFPIALLSLTANLAKSALLRLQVLILASAGFAVSLFHNYITIFPNSGVDVCGADGVSCTALYVYQFGYITIPMMSLTVLLAGIVLTLLASRFPHASVAEPVK